MRIANNITELIGNTPLVALNRISKRYQANIIAKLEFFNPCSSVKDRIGLSMIEDAEQRGLIDKNTILIEATSGNTGIGLAFVSAQKGYKLILVMPDTMSTERKKLLRGFGAQLELTPGHLGMQGAIKQAENILKKTPKAYMLRQFKNKANPNIHKKTTAEEIWKDTDGRIEVFVAGVGTGGTITGVSEALKQKNDQIKIIAVEPADSPVISGGKAGPHMIQGIGAGFIPDNLNLNIIDEVVTVSNTDAIKTSKLLMREEGILCGISSGAVVKAAIEISQRQEYKNKMIVTILPDTGERYLTTMLF